MNKKIIFSTGGTGGHIFPAINLMKHFFDKGFVVLLVTDNRGNGFIKNHSEFKSYVLNAKTPTNKNILKQFLSFFVIFYSIIKSIIILRREKPDLVFGFGGYVSFPLCFSARFFNIPLVIYENNSILGRANKYLLSFSKRIFLAKREIENFPSKHRYKISFVGAILDKKIINCSNLDKTLENESFSLLTLGGSQGAEVFGNTIPKVVKMIQSKGYKIKINQQCVKGQKNKIIEYYKKNDIKHHVFEFDSDILKLILSSDLAVTRCGASTTAELMHTLTPFIAIPLPNSIDNHQYLNAKYYENLGCCWILEEDNLNTENLFNIIIDIMNNRNKLKKIRENMKRDYSKNVYSNLENEINKII